MEQANVISSLQREVQSNQQPKQISSEQFNIPSATESNQISTFNANVPLNQESTQHSAFHTNVLAPEQQNMLSTLHTHMTPTTTTSHMLNAPPPIVTWYKDNRQLRPDDGYYLQEYRRGVCRLIVPRTSRGDSGVYSCRVQHITGGGVSYSSATVSVEPTKHSASVAGGHSG